MVAAAVCAQLRGRRDSSAEPENDVQDIQHQWEKWVDLERIFQCGWDEVEEREHAEDGNEEVVVDDIRVAAVLVDHVACERHDEEGP